MSISGSGSHEDSQSNTYGTHTPIISPQYNNMFNSYAKSLGYDPSQWMPTASGTSTPAAGDGSGIVSADPSSSATGTSYTGPSVQGPGAVNVTGRPITNYADWHGQDPGSFIPTSYGSGGNVLGGPQIMGANPLQSAALNWQANNLVNNPVNTTSDFTNSLLSWVGKKYTDLDETTLGRIRDQAAPQLSGTALASASTSAGAPTIDAPTGASMTAPYQALYSQALIDPSLAAYDYGTDRAFSALDARTAGAGAFGNTRSGLGYSDLGAQSALGRGQLASGLLTTGLTNAINAGQTDASRQYGANTQNAANVLNNNQFNANLLTNNSQFNAGLLQDAAKTNLAAQQTNTGQNLQATQQIAANLQSQAGLSQNILNNVVTANGINTQAAQQLFMNGAITQTQLASILSQAAAYNGSSYTQNTTGSTDKVSGSFNPLKLFD